MQPGVLTAARFMVEGSEAIGAWDPLAGPERQALRSAMAPL